MNHDEYYCLVTWSKKPFGKVRSYYGKTVADMLKDHPEDCTLSCRFKKVKRAIRMVMSGRESIMWQDKWHGLRASRHRLRVTRDTYLFRLDNEIVRLQNVPKASDYLVRLVKERERVGAEQPWYVEDEATFSRKQLNETERLVRECYSEDIWFRGGGDAMFVAQ